MCWSGVRCASEWLVLDFVDIIWYDRNKFERQSLGSPRGKSGQHMA